MPLLVDWPAILPACDEIAAPSPSKTASSARADRYDPVEHAFVVARSIGAADKLREQTIVETQCIVERS
jgi:hypothetical protein